MKVNQHSGHPPKAVFSVILTKSQLAALKNLAGNAELDDLLQIFASASLLDRPEATARQIKKLVRLAEKRELTSADLDLAVQELASGSASTANNDGLAGQIRWLVEQAGVEETKRLIEEAAEECHQ